MFSSASLPFPSSSPLQVTEFIIQFYDELFGEIGQEDGIEQSEFMKKLSESSIPSISSLGIKNSISMINLGSAG